MTIGRHPIGRQALGRARTLIINIFATIANKANWKATITNQANYTADITNKANYTATITNKIKS